MTSLFSNRPLSVCQVCQASSDTALHHCLACLSYDSRSRQTHCVHTVLVKEIHDIASTLQSQEQAWCSTFGAPARRLHSSHARPNAALHAQCRACHLRPGDTRTLLQCLCAPCSPAADAKYENGVS